MRALALWPLKQTPGIERNWAPLWSLYTRERAGDARDTELLWGIYHHRRTATQRDVSVFPLLRTHRDDAREARSWSLLYGLAGVEKEGVRRTWRLLYFLKFRNRPAGTAALNETGRDAHAGTTGTDVP